MIKIETLPLGQMEANCYIVHENGKAVIIDPADESDFISQKILELDLKPVAIIATHGHFDHILAAGELQLIFNIPFFIHPKDEFLIKEANKSAKFWLGQKYEYPTPQKIKYLNGNDFLKFDGLDFKIIETPGHTPGSICLFSKENNPPIIFSGDLIFKNGIGRSDFSYSNESDQRKSLKKISKLPKETIIYPGHGPITTIKEEFKK